MMTPEQTSRMKAIQWAHRIDLGDGVVTPGYYGHTAWRHASSHFGMPDDLSGKSVLDIGCSDGMFSFEAEQRGAARVLAVDSSAHYTMCIGKSQDWPAGFKLAKEVLGSNVEFLDCDLFHLCQTHTADVVLFYGVLYHLDDPIGGLRKVFSLVNDGGCALIETAVSSFIETDRGWVFQPGHDGDPSNKWYPSTQGLIDALKHVGFKEVDVVSAWHRCDRLTVIARK